MPISIRRIMPQGEDSISIAVLGDDEWSLPSQIGLLDAWIDANAGGLPEGEYVADVGFCWRRDAGGGGSALGSDLLIKMGSAGFSLFLSEYPEFSDGEDNSEEEAEQDASSNH